MKTKLNFSSKYSIFSYFKDHKKWSSGQNIQVLWFQKISSNLFLIIEECCDSFKIETVGGGNFYQEERLGNYFKIGNSEDGRNVYRQQNGDNYLYYVQDRSVRKTIFLQIQLLTPNTALIHTFFT